MKALKRFFAAALCVALLLTLGAAVCADAPSGSLYLPGENKTIAVDSETAQALAALLTSKKWEKQEDLYPEFAADYELTLDGCCYRVCLTAEVPLLIGVRDTVSDTYYGLQADSEAVYAQLLALLEPIAPIGVLRLPAGRKAQTLAEQQTLAVQTLVTDAAWQRTDYPEFDAVYELELGALRFRMSPEEKNILGCVDRRNGSQYGLLDPDGTLFAQLVELADGIYPCFSFADVPVDAWYRYYAERAFYLGFLTGTGDGTTFGAEQRLSRVMLVQMLYALSGKPTVTTTASGFTDVDAEAWYASAVAWAKKTGVAAGYSDGRFGVSDAVTREQLALMLAKYADYQEPTQAVQPAAYPDEGEVSAWAQKAMRWALQCGILSGKPQGTERRLAPQDGATRAEAAVMVLNCLSLLEGTN